MIDVIRAEMLKLRTARSMMAMCIAAVGLSLAFGVLVSLVNKDYPNGGGEELISVGGFSLLFTMILGILAMAGELRHGTIAPSLLVTPRRGVLLGGKLVAVIIVSALLGALSVGGCLAIGAVLLPTRGFTVGLSAGEVVGAIAAGGLAAALYGTIGVGVGALLRNQAGAIVLVLIWLFFVDPLLTGLLSALDPFSLTGAIDPALGAPSQSGSDNPVSQIHGMLVIGAYALALFGAGLALFRRVEITT